MKMNPPLTNLHCTVKCTFTFFSVSHLLMYKELITDREQSSGRLGTDAKCPTDPKISPFSTKRLKQRLLLATSVSMNLKTQVVPDLSFFFFFFLFKCELHSIKVCKTAQQV